MNTRILVVTLFFGAFVANMNAFALGPFLPPIADDIGSTTALVGQAVTTSLVMGAIIGLFLGPIGDHFGLRRLLVAGAILMLVSGIGTSLAFDFWSLAIARIPAGIAAGLLLGLGVSVINTRLPEDSRRSAIGWVVSAGALAAIFGIPLLAFLAEYTSWRVGFWLVGLLGVILAIAYMRAISPDPPVPDEPFRPFGIWETYREILADARMVRLQTGNLIWAMVWIGTLTYFGAYLIDDMGASLNVVGYMMMWGGTCFFLGNRIATWLARGRSPHVLLTLAGMVLSLSVFSTFSVTTGLVALIIVVGLLAFAGGVGLPLITIMISESAATAHGSVMMLRQFTWGMGAALGAASGGLLLGLGGFFALGIGLAMFALLAISIIAVAARTVSSTQPRPAVES